MVGPLISTISKSPWRRPLNWNLQTTWSGERRISFSFFVQIEPQQSSCSEFPQFCELPTELQLYIFRFCDAATLFQLMRVSAFIRTEAKKLFWSNPDAWYYVDCYWVLAGGFPGYAHHAIDFLAHVEQVEVDFDGIEMLWRDREAETVLGGHVKRSQSTEELISGFWQTLQNQFPRATRVLVSERSLRAPTESLPPDLEKLVEMCPTGITASASLFQYAIYYKLEDGRRICKRPERSLWQRTEGSARAKCNWERVHSVWTRQSILMPPKDFRGPVGEYERITYQFKRRNLRHFATRALLIEARERHHFDGRFEPFVCPEPGCEARFEQPGEWTLHTVETFHDYPEVPDGMEALFDQHDKRLEHMQHDLDVTWKKMRDDWGDEGSEKRHHAEQAFLHQLESDPLYAHGKPAKETSTWFLYKGDMNGDWAQ